jgi:hypothetical protein
MPISLAEWVLFLAGIVAAFFTPAIAAAAVIQLNERLVAAKMARRRRRYAERQSEANGVLEREGCPGQ